MHFEWKVKIMVVVGMRIHTHVHNNELYTRFENYTYTNMAAIQNIVLKMNKKTKAINSITTDCKFNIIE